MGFGPASPHRLTSSCTVRRPPCHFSPARDVIPPGAPRAVDDRCSAVENDAVLVLERYCGREAYPVLEARWNLYHDAELDLPTLCVALRAGPGVELHEDTRTLAAQPHWELNLVAAGLQPEALVPGAVFSIPEGYDDDLGGHLTNFYYCQHESTAANRIEILALDGSALRVRLRGETIDVNFYDGSKPATVLMAELRLRHDPGTRRSIC